MSSTSAHSDPSIDKAMSAVVGILAMLAIINAALTQLREWLRWDH